MAKHTSSRTGDVIDYRLIFGLPTTRWLDHGATPIARMLGRSLGCARLLRHTLTSAPPRTVRYCQH